MSAGFTPGPWRVEENTTLVWGACNDDDSASYGMGVPVAEATVWQPQWATKRHEFRSSEPEANAHLIAAAPELYEALNALLDACQLADAEGDLSDRVDGLLMEIAGEALAKARGEQVLS